MSTEKKKGYETNDQLYDDLVSEDEIGPEEKVDELDELENFLEELDNE